MKIDLSKLSPMSRRRVLQAMIKEARLQATNMREDLESFSEGEARTEMVAWKEALHELQRECNRMHLAS